jgi:hypothetical protein
MPKRIFISFDYDHDRHYRYLLSALRQNPRNDLTFDDYTPNAIESSDVGRVKAVLSQKIRQATHTLVIIGEHANSYHPDRIAIGTRNWQWWEVEKSIAEGNRLVGVKISGNYASPTPLLGHASSSARSFRVESIIEAIDEA